MRFRGFRDALGGTDAARSLPGMVLPLAVVALVTIVELLTGRDHLLAPMMIMAPALAAGTTTWRRTLLVGLIGALAQLALFPYTGFALGEPQLLVELSVSYVLGTLLSAYAAWWREERTAKYRAVESVAQAAQQALLRPPDPSVGSVRLAARYVSAADAALIGGDLYSVLDTPFGVRALVGDVRGKGLGAVQTASVVMGAFREAAYDEAGLARLAERVDASVQRHVDDGEFVTALFLEFPAPAAGTRERPAEVLFVHYGHVAPLRVSPDGTVKTLEPPDPGIPLGLAAYGDGDKPRLWRERVGRDEVLVLCTDGVIEARAAGSDDFYPLASRAGPLVAGSADGLDDALDRLFTDLLAHTGGTLGDDCVLMLLSRPVP